MAVAGVFAQDGEGEVDVLLQPAPTTVAGATATAPGVCVDHVFGDLFSYRVFLPENDEVVTDIVAEGGTRVRGDEQWTFCTGEPVATTVAGATGVA